MTARTVERTTALAAKADDVFAHATRLESVNDEMHPWLHMTAPADVRGLSLSDPRLTLGAPLFRSWVLFLRFLPVERMDVTIVELGPGNRFVEQSGVLFLRKWRHERTVAAVEGGCTVTDRLTLEPPIGLFAPLLALLVRAFFAHRHRKLVRRFGRLGGPA